MVKKSIDLNVPSYGWYNNGKGIDESLLDIHNKFRLLSEENTKLKEENASLRSEKYKDQELSRLSDEVKTLKENLSRGFTISQEDRKKIDLWMETHKEGVPKPHFLVSYRFSLIPGIGYDGYAVCDCGEEFCFYRE